MAKRKKWLGLSVVSLSVFVIFTLSLKIVDVRAIGPENSEVGLATLNQFVFQTIGTNLFWYHLTDWLGILAIVVAFFFAGKGVYQLVSRRSLFLVDRSIIGLGVLYSTVIACYIFFEKVILNYRPILMDHQLEASYPSSHTFFVVTILLSAIVELQMEQQKSVGKTIFSWLLLLIALITIIGRLLSGVHWMTDIMGGLLLSATLVLFYVSFVIFPRHTSNRAERE